MYGGDERRCAISHIAIKRTPKYATAECHLRCHVVTTGCHLCQPKQVLRVVGTVRHVSIDCIMFRTGYMCPSHMVT